jgi:hypothetical protein
MHVLLYTSSLDTLYVQLIVLIARGAFQIYLY